MSIDKEYRPESVEPRWVRVWEEARLFHAAADSDKPPFSMVIPPPNVTGKLHIGHVLVYTLHDVVARWRRMQGYDVLWLPGTDHAGIATQAVVERDLVRRGLSRVELGREAFEAQVWEWKKKYGDEITGALRRLGASCDWERERFTLDEGLSRAVRTVFVRLYEQGLIYRGRYIVNWCPRCRTAISDLETNYKTVTGRLYTIRYPAVEGSALDMVVATTRPETLLGDTGVAVHPADERYTEHVGARVQVPLTGRDVPIVADDFVDPEFGTGAVKITPAHDPNDFEAGKRNGLPDIVVIDQDGRMSEAAGDYAGSDRFEARERVVADLESRGLLLGVEPHEHAVGHCQRCDTMIEPLVSTQWFVRVQDLARPAIEAVERGDTAFVPQSWSRVYFEWMRNIHDWCISRQLWWGHRIPAWYCDPCGETVVAEAEPQTCARCSGPLRRDEDVLDTWFSSGLWPFSTMGWPERTPDLERYYPTTLLITGHDIIFFWVARMMMLGLEFMDDVPFHQVYIHGLVRDAHGQKMSKSKGNTVDPEELQLRYGTDAVRFTMAILAAPGNDIPLAHERMEGYRAFANKLWNATRFVLMRLGDKAASPWNDDDLRRVDRWILSRTERAVAEVERAFLEYRFDRAADALYHFIWHQFCDWYIEFVKPDVQDANSDAPRVETVRAVMLHTVGTLLRLLHPMMPFITEELWEKLPGTEGFIATADWPRARPELVDAQAEADVGLLQQLVVKTRNLRAESHIGPGERIELLVQPDGPETRKLIESETALVAGLVRASTVEVVDRLPQDRIAARGVIDGLQLAVPLEGVLDLDAERARLRKDLQKVATELATRERKLSNASFVERAPAEVVQKERRLLAELQDRSGHLERLLAQLESGGS
jgi:valyl-tRNA synthetase